MISEIAGASGTAKQKIILAENRSCAFYPNLPRRCLWFVLDTFSQSVTLVAICNA